MLRYLKSLCILGCLILSACQVGIAPQVITPSTGNVATHVETAVTSTNLRTVAPTEIQETPTFFIGKILPTLLYLQGNKLLEQAGDKTENEIASLPDAGPIKAAFRTGNILLVLREQGIQRLNMDNGLTDMIFSFDKLAMNGKMISTSDGFKVFFLATVTDSQAAFSFTSKVGFYDFNSETINPVLTYSQNLRILGLTKDNLGLYLLPIGQDPGFGKIFLFDIKNGEIAKEIAFRGELFASLAPDTRLLATMTRNAESLDTLENMISVYDLPSLPVTPPRTYKLPNAPSHITSVLWSPDSQILYTLLLSGDYYEEPVKSYGLWRLDIGSGEMSQLSNVTDVAFYLDQISANGEWLLLRHESKDEAIWVNTHTGEQQTIGLPANAVLVNGQ